MTEWPEIRSNQVSQETSELKKDKLLSQDYFDLQIAFAKEMAEKIQDVFPFQVYATEDSIDDFYELYGIE